MTDIYLHIVARMADYMDTHPYGLASCVMCDFAERSKAGDGSAWNWWQGMAGEPHAGAGHRRAEVRGWLRDSGSTREYANQCADGSEDDAGNSMQQHVNVLLGKR